MNILNLQNSIFKMLIEIFVFNKTTRMKIKSRWVKKHLQKYIDIALDKSLELPSKIKKEHIFWQYWHQGKENAPLLIQKCLESVEKYHPEQKRVILSYKDIADYVEIPSKYYDLVNKGNMSITFFSDVLRTYLLNQYQGGTWIDSTIYLTDKIPNSILNSKFFVFQKNPQTDWFENKMSSFFIHTRGISPIMMLMKEVFSEYWAENDFLINYFLIEHLVTMLSEATSETRKEWAQIPYFSASDTGILQKKLYEDFDVEEFEKIKKITSIHKLSYKVLKQENNDENTYYNFLIGGSHGN